jgi:hypothetical protein
MTSKLFLCTNNSVSAPGCLFRPEFFPSRIHIKEFKYLKPKQWFLSSRKYDPGCSSQIRIPDFGGQKGTGSRIRTRNTPYNIQFMWVEHQEKVFSGVVIMQEYEISVHPWRLQYVHLNDIFKFCELFRYCIKEDFTFYGYGCSFLHLSLCTRKFS